MIVRRFTRDSLHRSNEFWRTANTRSCLVDFFVNQSIVWPVEHQLPSISSAACSCGVSSTISTSETTVQLHMRPLKSLDSIFEFLDHYCKVIQKTTNGTGEVDTSNEIQEIIDLQRMIVRNDMMGYNYPNGRYNVSASKFEDLAIEESGSPVRSIIVSAWRSGSTFFGTTVNTHPGDFLHNEPLANFGVVKIRGPPLAERALDSIKAYLNCKYADTEDGLLKSAQSRPWLVGRSTYLWKRCQVHNATSYDHRYVSALCKLTPFQSMKLMRMRLSVAQELLADERLAVRILFLVRDSRGTIPSRNRVAFRKEGRDCSEPALLCAELVSDYKTAVELRKKYPNTFRVIRYEGLALDPYTQIEELFKFYGRDFHSNVTNSLDTHTTTKDGYAFGTSRNSTATPFRWKSDLDFQEVQEIQRTCLSAMEHWGYVPAMNITHQRKFNPLTDYVLN